MTTQEQQDTQCCLCGLPIDGRAHHAAPIATGLECCDACHALKVLPLRYEAVARAMARLEKPAGEVQFNEAEELRHFQHGEKR